MGPECSFETPVTVYRRHGVTWILNKTAAGTSRNGVTLSRASVLRVQICILSTLLIYYF